ncbi:hypothetical protein JCM8097_006765 [Rhodosporidiobolus ruineniae]
MSASSQPAPELADELAAFRAQWQQEARLRHEQQKQQPAPPPTSTSTSSRPQEAPSSPKQARRSLDEAEEVTDRLERLQVGEDKGKGKQRDEEEEAPTRPQQRPKSALELYEDAVASEREGRLQDALVGYRTAFRLDPDVDRAYHLASVAAQKHAASRGAEPHGASSSTSGGGATSAAKDGAEFRFERTVQLGPDYDAKHEHRSKEEAERELGSADRDSTHPSSTAFLLNWLLRSIAENPYERPPPPVSTTAPQPTSPSKAAEPLPPSEDASSISGRAAVDDPASKPPRATITPEEALAALAFIPADEDQPLPLAKLPHEVLLLILSHLVLSSILPPPRSAHQVEAEAAAAAAVALKGKRAREKKRTIKEEMAMLEAELELEDTEREWKSDVEALERFARTCRMARVLSLDSGLWRSLCLRTYVPPQQISREEDASQLVRQHGNDWRRFFIEHPRIRLDGTYISVVTYLRRGETHSVYAPTHLVTFYRYLRFYHHGLVLSLLTTDPPKTVVRRLNPTMRVKGLSFGRWRLRGELVEIWGLEDPSVKEDQRKYSFRMNCRLRSTARGRMNKLEMLSLATEHRQTLELEDVPIRPTKPFYFSKVAAYAGEEKAEQQ